MIITRKTESFKTKTFKKTPCMQAINTKTVCSSAYILLNLVWLLLYLTGCSKAPTDVDLFDKSIQLVDQYMHTNLVGAEAAMLELEKYTMKCEKAHSTGVNYDQFYAAVYSRLYRVEVLLGKRDDAERYFKMAVSNWQKMNVREGRPPMTPAEVRTQVEAVDAQMEMPLWRGQTNTQSSK